MENFGDPPHVLRFTVGALEAVASRDQTLVAVDILDHDIPMSVSLLGTAADASGLSAQPSRSLFSFKSIAAPLSVYLGLSGQL